MEVTEALLDLLARHDSCQSILDEDALRSEILELLTNRTPVVPPPSGLFAEVLAWVCAMRTHGGVRARDDEHYASNWSFLGGGKPLDQWFPREEDRAIGIGVKGHWTSRSEEAHCPLMIYRYSSLALNISGGLNLPNSKKDYLLADRIIQTGILILESRQLEAMSSLYTMQECLTAAKRYNRPLLRDLIELIIVLDEDDDFNVGVHHGFSYSLLFEQKTKLDEDQKSRVLTLMSRRFRRVLTTKHYNFTEANRLLHMIVHYWRGKGKQEQIKQFVKRYARGVLRESLKLDAFRASHFLEDLVLTCYQFGCKGYAGRIAFELTPLAIKRSEEMQHSTFETEVPNAELKALSDRMVSSPITESLFNAVMATILPPPSALADEVRREKREFGFLAFLGGSILDSSGRKLMELAGHKREEQARLGWTAQFHLMLLARFFGSLFRRYCKLAPKSNDEIIDWLLQSHAFDAEQRPILQNVFDSFDAENYSVTILLGVTQLERVVRKIVHNLGEVVMKPNKLGGFNYRPLDSLLKSKKLEVFLGERSVHHLRLVFTDPGSTNIRNNACHGAYQMVDYNAEKATLTIQGLILLGQVVREDADVSKGDEQE